MELTSGTFQYAGVSPEVWRRFSSASSPWSWVAMPATHVASPGTYDQKHITRFGTVRDCVAYGPGILDLAHQPDEWVGIDDMLVSAKVMAAATLSLLRAGKTGA